MMSQAELAPPARADPMLPMPFRIARRTPETADTCTLELVPAECACLFGFTPGQFNMLYAFGIGEAAISLCGDPGRPESLFHTIRAVGAVTRALCQLPRGAMIGVRGPFGRGWPFPEADGRDVLLIAGGIGLAPLRGALHRIRAQRARYGRVVLLYGARSPADVLYRRELERLARDSAVQLEITVDRAGPGWRGHVGLVTELLTVARFDPANTLAMLCGPEIMMRAAVRALRGRGLPDERLFLSLERNMKCAIGFCGHCQFGPAFLCRDGPVFRYDRIAPWLGIREL